MEESFGKFVINQRIRSWRERFVNWKHFLPTQWQRAMNNFSNRIVSLKSKVFCLIVQRETNSQPIDFHIVQFRWTEISLDRFEQVHSEICDADRRFHRYVDGIFPPSIFFIWGRAFSPLLKRWMLSADLFHKIFGVGVDAKVSCWLVAQMFVKNLHWVVEWRVKLRLISCEIVCWSVWVFAAMVEMSREKQVDCECMQICRLWWNVCSWGEHIGTKEKMFDLAKQTVDGPRSNFAQIGSDV